MKVLGIVSEYNPFHLGHVYHIEESIKRTGATHTICVMSGNFVQEVSLQSSTNGQELKWHLMVE